MNTKLGLLKKCSFVATAFLIVTNLSFAKNKKKENDFPKTEKDIVQKQQEIPSHKEHSLTPKYNVMINPFGIIGSFNLKVLENMTAGLGALVSPFSNTYGSGWGAVLRANYNLSGPALTDGWYVSPLVTYQNTGSSLIVQSGISISGLVGYHWVYRSGINLMLGAGACYTNLGSTMGNTLYLYTFNHHDGILPVVEFNLGYAF